MTKQEFLSKLEDLLSDLPADDREDALRFYQEYLEDAGEENEQTALAELGEVEQLAQQIRQACGENRSQQQSPKQQPQPEQYRWPAPVQYLRPNSSDYTEYRSSQTQTDNFSAQAAPASEAAKKQKDGPNVATIVILILIAILTFPLWIGAVGTIFGLLVGFGVAALVCIVCAVVALFSISSVGIGGLLVFGGCILVAGISLAIVGGIGWLIAKFGAPLINFIVNCVRKLVAAVNG